MNLKWKPPIDDGGSCITKYIIEVNELNKRNNWKELALVEHNVLDYNVANLESCCRYTFRVSAENLIGRGLPSIETRPIEIGFKFTVPDPPINCTARPISSQSCSIQFQPPISDGGSPILGYVVERKQKNSLRWLRCSKQPSNKLEFTINDLVEGFEYEFRVRAVNLAGESEPSLESKSVSAINLFEPPSEPVNLRFSKSSNENIELSWAPPLYDGGTPILEYIIEKQNPKTLKWENINNLVRILNTFHTIESLAKENNHVIRVIAVNKAGNGLPSKPIDLTKGLNENSGIKPLLLEKMNDIKVLVGETAILTGKIKCKPDPLLSWRYKNKKLELKDNMRAFYKDGTIELCIKKVTLEHSGEYEVNIDNQIGKLILSGNIIVMEKPKIIVEKNSENILITNGKNLNISCNVYGYPKPNIKWFYNNNDFINQVGRTNFEYGEKIASLYIKKIKRNEEGEYKIIAENEAGKAESLFFVKVLDVPNPPEQLEVSEITSFSCKLKWAPPKDDGNSPIINYHIEMHDTKKNIFIPVDKTSLNEHFLNRLTKGQKYQFRVFAENKIGLSEPCLLKEPVMIKSKFDVPGAPGIPEVSDIDKTSCRISWEQPRRDGGRPVIGYILEKKSGSKWIRINKDLIDKTFILLKDLTEGSEYIFRVCAVNEEGQGEYSKNSEQIIAKRRFDRPDPPIDVEVHNITKSSCSLTWRPPKKTGGQPITRYYVEMRSKGEFKFIRFTDDFISECEYEIKDLIENQEYEFRIIAENKEGQSLPSEPTRKVKIREHVSGEPPKIDQIRDCGNLIGTHGKIEAKVTGYPVPSITWKKGSRILNNSTRYSCSFAESIAVLYINNLDENDSGQYTIEADNPVGSDSKNFKYFVYEPPSIEYDKKFKISSLVSVGSNFRFSCQVNGCPTPEVLWYKDDARIKKDHKPILDNPVESQHYLTIKQCDRSDSGTYKIRAINSYGKDEAIFKVQIVDVPDRPSGPLEVNIDVGNPRVATLKWKHPEWDGGSDLTRYTIEFSKIIDPSISKSKILLLKNIYIILSL